MSSASPAHACMSASIASLSFVVARSSPVPSLALRMIVKLINATAINAVPVLEDVHVGTFQECSSAAQMCLIT